MPKECTNEREFVVEFSAKVVVEDAREALIEGLRLIHEKEPGMSFVIYSIDAKDTGAGVSSRENDELVGTLDCIKVTCICPICDGQGKVNYDDDDWCPTCDGYGWIWDIEQDEPTYPEDFRIGED